MTWHLDYASNNLEVRMKGFMPMLGEINKKWIFPDRYPQQKMIQEIEDYMDWQMNQFQKAVKNNPYKHLNYN